MITIGRNSYRFFELYKLLATIIKQGTLLLNYQKVHKGHLKLS